MKKFIKWALIIIVGIVVINAMTGGDEETATETTSNETKAEETTTTTEEPKEDAVKTAKIGETATIANVGFTVKDVEETQAISQEYGEDITTDGKFVIAEVAIKNDKKEALTIDSSFFKIKTGEGVEYEPTTSGEVMVAMSMNGEDDFFLQQVNPGLSKTGKVVFEVPADVDLSKTVLHAQTGFFGTESIEISLSK